MASTRVVWDLELGRGFGFGLDDRSYAGFEVAVTWSDYDGFRHWHGGVGRALLDYLLSFDQIVGFNSLSYDNLVAAGYLTRLDRRLADALRVKTVDLLDLLYRAAGRRYGLDAVARATLGESKLHPPATYDPVLLADYCERDVELTRMLDDYRRQYGGLYVRDGSFILLPGSSAQAAA